MNKLYVLCFLSLISTAIFANDAVLNKASRLYESDPDQSIQLLKSSNAKFKTTTSKMNLANWYFVHGYKSDALVVYEDVINLDNHNVDAILTKNIILSQKLALPVKQIYTQLLPYYDNAIAQRNVRYFNYIGYLALNFDASIAKEAFEHAVLFGDVPESYLGLGLAIEKHSPVDAAGYYNNLLTNNMLSEDDRSFIKLKLKDLSR